jgi:predicted small metal-binding protein
MVTIENAILHILDFNSEITVFSDEELDLQDGDTISFLQKHFEKGLMDNDLKSGVFLESSESKLQISLYINQSISFKELSVVVTKRLLDAISQSETKELTDVVVSKFSSDNSSYLGILLLSNKSAYTHQVKNYESKIKNDIIKYHAILPSPSQKINTMAFVNLHNLSVSLKEKPALYLDKEVYILSDLVLACSFSASTNDIAKIVNKAVLDIAEKHGENSAIAASKTKNYLRENAEISSHLEVYDLSREVFYDSDTMQEEFVTALKTAGIPNTVELDRNVVSKSYKTHKIKTDTGIEITFPVNYFANRDYIDFINNADGTISIELKNIGKIINK